MGNIRVNRAGSAAPSSASLRIAYVVAYFHPFQSGAEHQALLQGAELVRRGHQVRVITQMPEGADLPEIGEVSGIRVERVIRPDRRGPLFGPSFVRGVVRALRERRREIDVVHTHQALWEAIGTGAVKSVGFAPPTLVQPASSGYYGEAEELSRTRFSVILRRLILRNTAFAAISGEIEDQWLSLGVSPDRITRTRSGVDTARFRPRDHTFGEAEVPVVAFTGRLHPQKNLDLLINAWPEVARRVSAKLHLIGDGPERPRLEALARERGVADSVVFMGSMADPSEALRESDLFALPSLCEGMSNSVLEALATGLPALVSDVGGNRDLVTEGVNGRLLRLGDGGGWSRAMIELLEDRSTRARMGVEARRGMETTYSIERVVDDYLCLYRCLMDRGG